MRRLETCIYCLERKPGIKFCDNNPKTHNGFNTEHVVNKGFGTFGPKTMVLIDFEVCQKCNSYFGNYLDVELLRDSPEGVLRIIRQSDSENKAPQTRVQMSLPLEFLSQVKVWIDGNGKPRILPQFHLTKILDGKKDVFLFKGNELNNDIDFELYLKENPAYFSEDNHTSSEIKLFLKNKGFIVGDIIQREPTSCTNFIDVQYEINDSYKRALAKILFNYACLNLGKKEMLKDEWNSSRSWIRYGQKPIPCEQSKKPFWADESDNYGVSNNSINIRIKNNAANDCVIGSIQILGLLTHNFLLAINHSILSEKEIAHYLRLGEEPTEVRKRPKNILLPVFDDGGNVVFM